MTTFSLVNEAWIPVLRNGKRGLVSLETAVTEANAFSGLVPGVPTQAPAILRQVLLPVVLHALGPPVSRAEWADRFQRGGFSGVERDTLLDYLDRYRDRFDLFHEVQPFAQVGGLRTGKGDTKSAALLVPAIASGNNVPLFSSRTEGDVLALTAAQAAMWLLHTQCWDTAGIKSGVAGDRSVEDGKGKTMGNPTGPLGQLGVVVPVGRSLFETIMLNVPVLSDGFAADDQPQWCGAVATPAWEPRRARGWLELLTWQSRRIRLFPESTVDGLRVARVIVAAGDRLIDTPHDYEPHTTWRVEAKPKAGQPALRPRRFAPGKAAWRGLESLLALQRPADDAPVVTSWLLKQVGELCAESWLDGGYPLRVETCGIQYGKQSAVIEDAMADTLPVPVAALAEQGEAKETVLEVADQAERLADAVNNLSADLRRALGGDPVPRDKGQRPGDMLIHALDKHVRLLLTQVQKRAGDIDELENCRERWERAAGRIAAEIAASLLESAAPRAFHGRERDGRPYRLANAELTFRGALNRILPRAAECRLTMTR